MSTFLHQAYDEATSTKQELQAVQFKVQIVSSPLLLTCMWRFFFGCQGIMRIIFDLCVHHHIHLLLQLRETHDSEKEKAYQLKAKIIEVHTMYERESDTVVVVTNQVPNRYMYVYFVLF